MEVMEEGTVLMLLLTRLLWSGKSITLLSPLAGTETGKYPQNIYVRNKQVSEIFYEKYLKLIS